MKDKAGRELSRADLAELARMNRENTVTALITKSAKSDKDKGKR